MSDRFPVGATVYLYDDDENEHPATVIASAVLAPYEDMVRIRWHHGRETWEYADDLATPTAPPAPRPEGE